MDSSPQENVERFCGVDRELLKDFLELIRDQYKQADKAAFFLEERAGVSNIQGIANMRDVLSHLATMLDPDTPDTKKGEQLTSAKEHLRRATVEPYEIALGQLSQHFAEVYQKYKEVVFPNKDEYPVLHGAPDLLVVDMELQRIQGLAARGREAKLKNSWDSKWEEGVVAFLDAYDLLTTLCTRLEEYESCFKEIERKKKHSEETQEILRLQKEIGRYSERQWWVGIWALLATLAGIGATAWTIFHTNQIAPP